MSLLKDFVRGKTPLQRKWAAGLWQRGLREQPSSGVGLVVFAIPLVSRRRASDWDRVSSNLARTLASLRAQSSRDWRAFVCGQDAPDGVDFDEQVSFLPFAGGDKFYDKGDKRLAILDHALSELSGRDGYYAQFDADDLLRSDVVAAILASDNGRGYLIEQGYMADLGARMVAPLVPAPPGSDPESDETSRAFWQLCGSCVFARFDFRDQPDHWRRLLRRLKSHKRMAEVMAEHGLPLEALPFPAGLYTLNHGENMSRRRNRESWRMGYLTRHALTQDEADDVLAQFGQ